MEKLLESHPDHVRQHSAIIMSCLSDIDVTIKMQALQLVDGIVAADNLQLVCDQLAENLTSAPPGAYRDALGHKIIQVCSRNRYALVRDFGWYLSLLVNKVCRVDSSAFEDQIAAQLVAVVVRVPPVQQPAVQMLLPLLAAGIAINGPVVDQDAPMVVLDAVLRAAAWVVAEYGDAGKTDADAARKLFKIFSLLINSRTRTLSPASQAVFLHSALKVLLRVLSIHNAGDLGNDIRPALAQMCELVTTHAPPLAGLLDATNEVRMRVHNLTQAAAAVAARVGVTSDTQAGAPADAATGTADLLQRLVAYAAARATPVSAKAQGRVAIPDGLRMKKWISKPAKQRAIAARSRILEQRSGTASGRPTRYSLANLRITEEDDDGDRKDGSDSGDDNGGGGDDSSDEFAQFRTNSGDEGSSSSGEAAPASEADQKRALFYIGGGGGSGGKSKKSKKAKKRSSKPRSPKQSSLSEVLNGSADTTSAAPITASVILGSDDDSDDAAATRRGQAGDALAGIDLSAPSNDGLSFEALKQRHRTDVAASEATPSAVSAKAKKDKKKKDKKKKKKHHSSSSSSKKHQDGDDVEASTGAFFGGGEAGDAAKHDVSMVSAQDGGELDEFDLSGDEELEKLDDVVVGSRGTIVGGGSGAGGATLSSKDRKKLHQIVFGETVPFKSKKYFNSAWLRQGFSFSEHEDLKYGLIQNEGGPCGPLACVQAHVLLHFMTAHGLAGDEISKRVTADMQQEAITAALTTILWRAACQRKGGEANANAIVALPEDPKSRGDPLVEGMELHSFRDKGALASFLASKAARRAYCSLKGPGIALFVCSVALSRGLDAIHDDFDTAQGLGESAFLTSHFYASQLLVNLCLVGRAVPNVFDGEQTADEFLLRGIPSRSDVGFLTLYEHHDYVRAGSHYKLPRFPIWVVCSESHYSTFFAAASDAKSLTEQLSGSFDLLYFDG
eukprot:INCI8300.4.p1 GENE.INCI8300.4~~INCI8300.4.p1  ORF type:complete len:955 (-),score=241.98 INCI8300.4:848-3712(-)